ncbi:uncharacterized protein K452DRAFT_281953, partial [Aplosporella prunicola CBS 121167]
MGSIRVLQANVNRNKETTEALLNYALEINVNLILIQEPWVLISSNPSDTRSINHTSFIQTLPETPTGLRPRVLVYTSRFLTDTQVNFRADLFASTDTMVLDILQGTSQFQLVNLYNQPNQREPGSPYTIERDPRSPQGPRAQELVDWLESNNLSLLNNPGEGTFFRPHLERETVIDLTLASPSLARRVNGWQTTPSLGSDHRPILFTIDPETRSTKSTEPTTTRFNTRRANWPKFREIVQHQLETLVDNALQDVNLLGPPSKISREIVNGSNLTIPALDELGRSLEQAITYAADTTIPRVKPGARSKAWWSEELTNLRRALGRADRLYSRLPTPTHREQYCTRRNTFLSAVKRAKRT